MPGFRWSVAALAAGAALGALAGDLPGSASAILAPARAPGPDDPAADEVLSTWRRQAGSWWSVVLTREPDGSRACLALAMRAAPREARFAVGLRRRWPDDRELELYVADPLALAGFGRLMTLVVDGAVVGRFPIAPPLRPRRSAPRRASAPVPPAQEEAVLRSLRVGKAVRLVTDAATYSVALVGVGAALDDFAACVSRAADPGVAPSR